jgi:hypothetical protein
MAEETCMTSQTAWRGPAHGHAYLPGRLLSIPNLFNHYVGPVKAFVVVPNGIQAYNQGPILRIYIYYMSR